MIKDKFVKLKKGGGLFVALALLLIMALPVVAITAGTVVSISDASAANCTTVTVPIRIDNVTDLAAADIWLQYDKNVVQVTAVTPGDVGALTFSIDNVNGVTKMNFFKVTPPYYSGDRTFATVTLHAVGSAGQTSPLDLVVQELIDGSLDPIPYIVVNGTFTVSGAAGVPDISVNPTSKNFGSVNVGSSSSAQTFTVSNDGTDDLDVGTITITGSGASHFAIQNDLASGQTIAPTGSLTLEVVFSPTSTGTKTANLSIPSNDPDEDPLTASLQGTGVAAACNNGSANVAFIPNPVGPGGGTLPTTNSAFDAFTFTNVPFASVSAATLASYDTVVLISCDPLNDLSSSQRTDLINWLSDGGKLIIYDSECVEDTGNPTNDFTWLPCGFESYGPGGWGATADSDPWVTLEIIEDNTLSSSDSGSPYFIDTDMIAHDTDGAGDMNVFLTQETCWCGDMLGTNAIDEEGQEMSPGTTGYVHAYSHYGQGLMIYNGLDIDWMGSSTDPTLDTGTSYLAKIWLLELQQPWGDTCGLPCAARITPLACDFEGWPITGYAPLTVQFTDLTTGTPDTWQWSWDFGDGATSTMQNPTHTYTAAGRYTVSLGVTTSLDESCTETKVAYIIVRELPMEEEEPPNLVAAYLLVSPEQVQPNQQVEISINIGNDGGTTGTRSIALYINGHLEDSQTVSVSPGSAKNVVFRVTKSEPGTYQVMLEGNVGQFIVLSTAGAGHWAGPLGTGGIIAIVVFVIALVLGLVFILRRE
jgi:hypothetical protein